MKYCSINPNVDYAITPENEYIFFFGDKFKYIKILKTKELEVIIDYFAYGEILENFFSNLDYCKKCYKKTISVLLKKEILLIQEIKNEFQFKKYYTPELYENNRFGYQTRYLKRFYSSEFNFNEFQNKKVAIIGAGTIGSFIAVTLAAMNVRNIIVIDGDVVSESNLSRQIFYKESDIDKKFKVDSLQEYIKNLNSNVKFQGFKIYINEKFLNYEIFKNVDLIIQTADKPTGKIDLYVDEISKKLNISTLYLHNGSIGPFIIPGKTKTYLDFVRKLDEESKGLYSKSINYQSSKSKTAFETSLHLFYTMLYQIIDDVLIYLIYSEIPRLKNKIWFYKDNSYIDF
ncbi:MULTISPECIES: HesA/MoeB/ThiF family protein [Streptobacillus]|uniref:HesA/MoeB/ThiF family protein n=1 Tax=Streptobacillus TaxID=34104 RepID=UPI0007E4CB7C|nr:MULTISPECIES: ThiF family adenylyltransferase [Streptobacillus]